MNGVRRFNEGPIDVSGYLQEELYLSIFKTYSKFSILHF